MVRLGAAHLAAPQRPGHLWEGQRVMYYMLCYILYYILYYVILYYVMLYYIMLYYIMLYYIMLCYIILCYIITIMRKHTTPLTRITITSILMIFFVANYVKNKQAQWYLKKITRLVFCEI